MHSHDFNGFYVKKINVDFEIFIFFLSFWVLIGVSLPLRPMMMTKCNIDRPHHRMFVEHNIPCPNNKKKSVSIFSNFQKRKKKKH